MPRKALYVAASRIRSQRKVWRFLSVVTNVHGQILHHNVRNIVVRPTVEVVLVLDSISDCFCRLNVVVLIAPFRPVASSLAAYTRCISTGVWLVWRRLYVDGDCVWQLRTCDKHFDDTFVLLMLMWPEAVRLAHIHRQIWIESNRIVEYGRKMTIGLVSYGAGRHNTTLKWPLIKLKH